MLPLMKVLDPAHAQPAHARELRPPVAARRPVVAEHRGVQRSGDYGWLKTGKLEQMLQRPEALEKPILPEARGPWQYSTRFSAGAQCRLLCRRPRAGGPEQVLDENALARLFPQRDGGQPGSRAPRLRVR